MSFYIAILSIVGTWGKVVMPFEPKLIRRYEQAHCHGGKPRLLAATNLVIYGTLLHNLYLLE